MSADDARAAAELVRFGLRQGSVPAREPDYRRLVERFLDSTTFQELVHAVARGLQLRVLDVEPEIGVVLMPESTESPFATGLSDYRATLGVESKQVPRAAFVLAQAAVASSLYPSADALEYPDPQPPNTTTTEVCERLVELSARLERQLGEDPEEGDATLAPGWRHILSLPRELPQSERHSPNSLRGLIQLVLNHLCEQRLLAWVPRRGGEEDFYVATAHYRIMLAHNAGTILRVLTDMLAVDEAASPDTAEDS